MCVSKMVVLIEPSDTIIDSLFWVSIAICQLGHPGLFEGGLLLIQSTLEVFSQREFNGINLPRFLLASRDNLGLGKKWMDGDVDFKAHFSLSISVVLLPGLKDPSLKVLTMQVLTDLLILASIPRPEWKTTSLSQTYIMGYLIPLLPSVTEINGLLEMIGEITDHYETVDSSLERLVDAFLLQDSNSIFIQLCYLYKLMENSDDSQNTRVFKFFTVLAQCKPEIFSSMYKCLI
jgi:hypothetical protein